MGGATARADWLEAAAEEELAAVGGVRAEVGRVGGAKDLQTRGARQMETEPDGTDGRLQRSQLTDGALTPPWLVCGPCPPPASPSSACLWPGESQQKRHQIHFHSSRSVVQN